MSPATDRNGSVPATKFALGSYEKFQPGFRISWRPTSKHGETQKYNFLAYLSFGNSYSCITAVKWDAYDVENTASNARLCNPDRRQSSSCFHPGNRAEVFIWQKIQPAN